MWLVFRTTRLAVFAMCAILLRSMIRTFCWSWAKAAVPQLCRQWRCRKLLAGYCRQILAGVAVILLLGMTATAQTVSIQFEGGLFKVSGSKIPSPPAAGWSSVFAVYTGAGDVPPLLGTYRSEERRVGKECRSRWSPY